MRKPLQIIRASTGTFNQCDQRMRRGCFFSRVSMESRPFSLLFILHFPAHFVFHLPTHLVLHLSIHFVVHLIFHFSTHFVLHLSTHLVFLRAWRRAATDRE